MIDSRYPIGIFKPKSEYTPKETASNLKILRNFPEELEKVLDGITEKQLATAYRINGWTAQQVIHHIADSHMNMLIRVKWAQTEDSPKIKAYLEDRWATLSDYNLPFAISVNMLESIHAKVVALLENVNDETLNKGYLHPETNASYSLKTLMALYAWHGAHHLAHIKICKGEWLS